MTGLLLLLVPVHPLGSRLDAASEELSGRSWEAIGSGLHHLARGDLGDATASFKKATRAGEPNALAQTLRHLTTVYSDYSKDGSLRPRGHQTLVWLSRSRPGILPSHSDRALAAIRAELAEEAPGPPSPMLRALLCHLRLLTGDRSTAGERAVRVTGPVEPPRKVFFFSPQYTGKARRHEMTGLVIVESTIDSEGCVQNTRVLKEGPGSLHEATRRTIQWWVFQPAAVDGKSTRVIYNLSTRFSIQRGQPPP